MLIIASACIVVVAWLLILSLQSLFRRQPGPAVADNRLDIMLEVDEIVASIEQFANREPR
jgi:hypothetical protein